MIDEISYWEQSRIDSSIDVLLHPLPTLMMLLMPVPLLLLVLRIGRAVHTAEARQGP